MARMEPTLGEEIESELMLATQISIIHKQGSAGCLRPEALWSCWCPISTKRSFNWIAENAILKNKAFYIPWDPRSCAIGETYDVSSMMLLDEGKFHPCCHGAGSPCGPRGYATQDDLFRCFCVDCSRGCNRLLRPLCGEFLFTVPCENGSRNFGAGAIPCLMYPAGCCLEDSRTYRAVLMKQVAHAQGLALTNSQRRALAPSAHGMTR